MAKLNIGAGEHPLDGWTNVDIGGHPGTLRMDATQRFPFPDGDFSHIFCEHTLEHLPYHGALFCLRECWRTLQPGGRIRVSIPHVQMLVRLFQKQNDEFERSYIEWHCQIHSPGAPVGPETVWNNFFRAWGHQFMWSENLLREEMTKAEFKVDGPYPICVSPDAELCNLENHTRMPFGFLQLETVTLEGVKPLA